MTRVGLGVARVVWTPLSKESRGFDLGVDLGERLDRAAALCVRVPAATPPLFLFAGAGAIFFNLPSLGEG